MAVWDNLRKRVEIMVEDIRQDPRFEQTVRDAERIWQDVEREVAMIREQIQENSQPIVDDTHSLKQKLDAYRKRSRNKSEASSSESS